MTSVAALVEAAAARLSEAGFTTDDARRDAGVLARGLLGWSLADWLSRSHSAPPAEFEESFRHLIERRRTREPVAYLLGTKEFYGRLFRVTPDTLIPRPETEGLVEAALAWLSRTDTDRVRLVDVGTGTGCIAISIALEAPGQPGLDITATDVSPAALEVASGNAARHGAAGIDFRRAAFLDSVVGPVDLIVSNPPYVPSSDRDTMQPDVAGFEPGIALFAGADGLDVIRHLIASASRVLTPGGALMLEIGIGQADAVAALMESAGFTSVERRRDLQGIDRIIVAHIPTRSL